MSNPGTDSYIDTLKDLIAEHGTFEVGKKVEKINDKDIVVDVNGKKVVVTPGNPFYNVVSYYEH